MTFSQSADPNLVSVLYLCEELPAASFLQKVLQASSDSLEEGRANFARLLQQTDEEDDIALDLMDFEFSLLDPLSYQRMRIPVRSVRCSHVKCFDLENFMELYPEKANRSCPVCGSVIKLQDLRQDPFVKSILQQTSDDEDEVKMTMNGEWKHCEREGNIEDLDDMEEESDEDDDREGEKAKGRKSGNHMEELQMPGGNGYATAAIPEIPPVVVMDMPNPMPGSSFYPNNLNAFGQPFEQAIQSVDPEASSMNRRLYPDFSSLLDAAMAFDNNEIIDLVSCSSVEDDAGESTNHNNNFSNNSTSMYNTNCDPNLGSQIEIIDISD